MKSGVYFYIYPYIESRYGINASMFVAFSNPRWLIVYWTYPIFNPKNVFHYDDAIMGTMASQITSLAIVYSTVYSGADRRKHQSSASLAFVRGIHRGPVNSPHKWSVTRKMFPFDDVIMWTRRLQSVVRFDREPSYQLSWRFSRTVSASVNGNAIKVP